MLGTWQRHFVVHSAHKTVGVSLVPIDVETDFETHGEEASPLQQQTLRIGLVTPRTDGQSAFSAEILAEYLESVHFGAFGQICCQVLDDWADLDDLAECHGAVVFLGTELPAEWLAAAAQHAGCGAGLIGLRAADSAWLRPAAPGSHLFGAECAGCHPNPGETAVHVAEPARMHPTVAGVRPFTTGERLVKTRILDAEPVLVGSVPGASEAVAWTRRCGAGRGFCTTLGYPADFRQPSFLRLLANAISWTCRGDVRP